MCSINKRSVSPGVFSISSVLGTECTPTTEINDEPQRDMSVSDRTTGTSSSHLPPPLLPPAAAAAASHMRHSGSSDGLLLAPLPLTAAGRRKL